MIYALLPAAGRSERMGQPKLMLPLAGRSVLEHCIAAFRRAGVERILVVAPPEPLAIAETARRAEATVLHLQQPTADMQATVQAGLRWMTAHWQPTASEFWLLSPADHPVLNGTVIQVLTTEAARQEASIFVPTWQGRRGHPALFAWPHAAAILQLPPGTGIHQYIRRQASAVREVPVASPSVLFDLDTPEDYERLLTSQDLAD